ncbi:MAG: Gfo/Idh/MocA family oxidoreductase [Thermodesulfobacteriota bacterium]
MPSKPGTITLGIIGCGEVTETFHLPSLKLLPNIEVAALSDIDKRKLDRAAETFGINNRYEDPYELINSKEIDAVAVCTPSGNHYALGMAVLDSGKNLFMEKPPALSMVECAGLVNKARGSPLRAQVGFNLRWHRNVSKAKEIIGKGLLGKIESARSVMSVNDPELAEWRKKRALGGGSLLDLGIHHFDLLRHLLNAEAELVHAAGVSGEVEDETTAVSVKLTNGILCSSIFSYGSGHANEIEIFGSNGIMKISLYDIAGLELRPCDAPPGGLFTGVRRAIDRFAQTAANAGTLRHGGIFKESYYSEWRSFADSVIHGKDTECGLEDGMRALEIALAAVESASTGIPVKLSGVGGEAE